MDDVLWRDWWDRTGEAHVRKVLLENWDPIEVAPAVRRGEWTAHEYDAYVAAVGRVLRDMGGSADEIADCLVTAEREDIGFVGDRQRAEAVAQRIAAWYEASFPNNRASAVDYARRVAQQIVDGDYATTEWRSSEPLTPLSSCSAATNGWTTSTQRRFDGSLKAGRPQVRAASRRSAQRPFDWQATVLLRARLFRLTAAAMSCRNGFAVVAPRFVEAEHSRSGTVALLLLPQSATAQRRLTRADGGRRLAPQGTRREGWNGDSVG